MSEELNQETPSVESNYKATEKKPNLNLIINIVLGVAVVVLFILQLTGGQGNSPVVKAATLTTSGKIAFVNSDSIMSQYGMAKEIKAQLEDKIKKVQGELSAREQSFQKKVTDFQQKIQAKSVTQDQAQKTNELLTQEKQSLDGLSSQYQQMIAQQQQELTVALHDTITNFLKRFNKDVKFDYIFNFHTGGDLLFQNPGLDITNDVIKGLNEDYKKHNQGKK
jgi:outer membrane protein